MAWKIAIVRKKLFVPLALSMAVFMSGMMFTVYRLQWDHINADTTMRIAAFHRNFQDQVQGETELLNGILYFIKGDGRLQKDWQARDRDALLRDAMPIFQEMLSRHQVTHFYFITPDMKCFLRVHKPESSGDTIDRITMDVADHLGKPAHGLELGPFGTFTLRVVHPWIIDGKLAGYIELGEEVDHITERISRLMNVDMLAVVAKKYLKKSSWEEGQRMLGHQADWDRFKHFVATSGNADKTYVGLDNVLNGSKVNDQLFTLDSAGRTLKGGFDVSIDAAGNDVGRYIIFYDVTGAEKSLYGLLLRLGAFTLVISGLALAFFDWYISRIHYLFAKGQNPSAGDGGGDGAAALDEMEEEARHG